MWRYGIRAWQCSIAHRGLVVIEGECWGEKNNWERNCCQSQCLWNKKRDFVDFLYNKIKCGYVTDIFEKLNELNANMQREIHQNSTKYVWLWSWLCWHAGKWNQTADRAVMWPNAADNVFTGHYRGDLVHTQREYPAISCWALKLLVPFTSSYLCEAGYSALICIKTKYWSRLDVTAEIKSKSNVFI